MIRGVERIQVQLTQVGEGSCLYIQEIYLFLHKEFGFNIFQSHFGGLYTQKADDLCKIVSIQFYFGGL